MFSLWFVSHRFLGSKIRESQPVRRSDLNVRAQCKRLFPLMLFLFALASCGKSTQAAGADTQTRIENFEGHRALYLVIDTTARAEFVAQDLRSQRSHEPPIREGALAGRVVAGASSTTPAVHRPVVQSVPYRYGGSVYDSRCSIYEGLADAALRKVVYTEVNGHYVLYYRRARDHMYGLAEPVIDVFDGVIEDTYTGRKTTPDGTRTPGGMNTEHSWPRSKGSRKDPAKSDVHHLFIIDAGANSRRQNFEFGEPVCGGENQPECRWVSENHGDDAQPSRIGDNASGEPVFEVRSARRGDVARAQFYFSIRYQMPILRQTEEVLRRWHAEDPPDDFERERNRRIELVQHNRNPFVDCPGLVDSIDRFASASE